MIWLAFGLYAAEKAAALIRRLNPSALISWSSKAALGLARGLRYLRREFMEEDATDVVERRRLAVANAAMLNGLLLVMFGGYLMELCFLMIDHWKVFEWQGLKDIGGAVLFALAVSIVRRRQQNLSKALRERAFLVPI
jgi:hypothetical protein